MITGVYVGCIKKLQGERALLQKGGEAQWLAQFNDQELVWDGRRLGYGWHPFPKDSFKVEENESE